METDPTTITPVPVPNSEIPEVNTALTLTENYVSSGADKIAQVATIIGGSDVAKYGFSSDNVKKVMMFVGAYTSLKFLYDRGFKYKWSILGTAVAIYLLRTHFAGQEVSGSGTSALVATTPNNSTNNPT